MPRKRKDRPVERLRSTWTSTTDLEETMAAMFQVAAEPSRPPYQSALKINHLISSEMGSVGSKDTVACESAETVIGSSGDTVADDSTATVVGRPTDTVIGEPRDTVVVDPQEMVVADAAATVAVERPGLAES